MEKKDIKDLDCSKMVINPLHPQLVSFMEKEIPPIKRIKIDYKSKTFTKSMLYRYILLMYDEGSEVQKLHSLDFFEKKYEACAYAGFDLKKGKDGYYKFEDRVHNMILGKEGKITDIIVLFLGYFNKPKWNYLVFLHESMLAYTRDAVGRKKTDSKSSREYRTLYEDYHRLSSEIGHTHDETEEFTRRFYSAIEKERASVRPEDYAERLENGDDLRADNYYGVGYVVDKIRFLGDEETKVKA